MWNVNLARPFASALRFEPCPAALVVTTQMTLEESFLKDQGFSLVAINLSRPIEHINEAVSQIHDNYKSHLRERGTPARRITKPTVKRNDLVVFEEACKFTGPMQIARLLNPNRPDQNVANQRSDIHNRIRYLRGLVDPLDRGGDFWTERSRRLKR
jgi:hypothetical protein